MILGDMKYWPQEKHAFHPVIQKAVQYLRDNEVATLSPGKYEIEGADMFALVQDPVTVPISEQKSEHHAKYIDLQYVVAGEEEVMVVARQSERNQPIVNELESQDYALYDQVEGEMQLYLKPGMFVVLFPNDLHRPNCSRKGDAASLRKVVIKINTALLNA